MREEKKQVYTDKLREIIQNVGSPVQEGKRRMKTLALKMSHLPYWITGLMNTTQYLRLYLPKKDGAKSILKNM